MGTTRVLHSVHPNAMRGWMEKDVVCHLECPWFGGCLEITLLTVIAVWCPLLKMVCPCRKNQHLCIRIYHQQTACASWRWTFCSWTSRQFCYMLWRWWQSFFKQQRTTAISFKRCRQLAKHRLLQS